jgi:hypothetical protein
MDDAIGNNNYSRGAAFGEYEVISIFVIIRDGHDFPNVSGLSGI